MELSPHLPVLVALPFLCFPARKLHVNLFFMGNYLLFGLSMYLVLGGVDLGTVGARKGNVKIPQTP